MPGHYRTPYTYPFAHLVMSGAVVNNPHTRMFSEETREGKGNPWGQEFYRHTLTSALYGTLKISRATYNTTALYTTKKFDIKYILITNRKHKNLKLCL